MENENQPINEITSDTPSPKRRRKKVTEEIATTAVNAVVETQEQVVENQVKEDKATTEQEPAPQPTPTKKRTYTKKANAFHLPVSVPLEVVEKKDDYSVLTLRQFKRKKKIELKRQKEKEKQLRAIFDAKEIDDPTEEKYIKIERYDCDVNEGLNTTQVNKRQAEGLTNLVKNKYSKSYAQIFCSNLFTFFNFLCLVCVFALVVAKAQFGQFSFVAIYLINLIIGIVQEIRSKITIEKMSLVKVPLSKVRREEQDIEIPTSELVLDDIVLLATGNQVPCDCIIVEGSVEVNESLLTGESVAVKKTVGDKLFGGSYISGGKTIVKIDRIGDDSYIQRLSARAKKFKKSPSQLLNAINSIIKIIGILIIPISALMGIVNFTNIKFDNPNLTTYQVLQQAIPNTASVIIGMIPSGMFLLTSMALAVGVIRLSKHHTLVQDMYALEMLARIDVLCLDKTGTITDGKMKVEEVIMLGPSMISIRDIVGSMQNALRNNNMTSIALNDYFGLSSALVPKTVIPFSSDRKYSAVTFTELGTFVLGAPDFVVKSLPERVSKLIQQNTMLGGRVLLLAGSSNEINNDKVPNNLKPVALIILHDNIRPDAIKTIDWFKNNGVTVKVISGDDPITVSEIARRAGVEHSEAFINLDGLNDKEVFDVATKYSVFGRVSPEQKSILIKAFKTHGHTVAMTGDGVNDILAMKEADCSITVASGSDATRNISHLVLMDNNFNSMPQVVNEGRRVINNIQQSSSLYLMKTLFTILFATISIITRKLYPFNTAHMLALEFLVIGAASFFLSLQPNHDQVKGSFIHSVISNALPGALILVFNVYAFDIMIKAFSISITAEMQTTIKILLVTLGGLVYLYKVCEPLDMYRGILYSAITMLMIIWVFFLMDLEMFGLQSIRPLKDNWQYLLIMLCILELNFPLLRIISKIINKIKITPDYIND